MTVSCENQVLPHILTDAAHKIRTIFLLQLQWWVWRGHFSVYLRVLVQ